MTTNKKKINIRLRTEENNVFVNGSLWVTTFFFSVVIFGGFNGGCEK